MMKPERMPRLVLAAIGAPAAPGILAISSGLDNRSVTSNNSRQGRRASTHEHRPSHVDRQIKKPTEIAAAQSASHVQPSI